MSETESEVIVTISAKLKQTREQQGLTIEGVAETLNLSEEQISELEHDVADVKELSPFQRGYLRNYANLLGMDLTEIEAQFPDGIAVGSDLYSVQRYSYKVSKPLMGRGWFKALIWLIFIAAIAIVVASLDINLDDFNAITGGSESTQIVLPEIEGASETAPSSSEQGLLPLPEPMPIDDPVSVTDETSAAEKN